MKYHCFADRIVEGITDLDIQKSTESARATEDLATEETAFHTWRAKRPCPKLSEANERRFCPWIYFNLTLGHGYIFMCGRRFGAQCTWNLSIFD